MAITTAQIRAARGLLNWNQTDLADRTGISATSIGSIENGQTSPRASTLATIRKAFETDGVEFIGSEGVRLRTGEVRTFHGQDGFVEFFDHVYNSVKHGNEEIYACNVQEKKFIKWAGDSAKKHMERMSKVDDLSFKVLLKEGDTDYSASEYVQYRWLPEDLYSAVPFYTFDKQLAIILLENEPVIMLLDYPAVAAAYRKQFTAMWNIAIEPNNIEKLKVKK